jgi:hypothetical protein
MVDSETIYATISSCISKKEYNIDEKKFADPNQAKRQKKARL